MIIYLEIPLKAYSVNKYYYGNRSIKRSETVNWEREFIHNLRDDKSQSLMLNFHKNFNPKTDAINVEITCQYPKKIIYTKEGALSSRAFDISNTEKPILDILCDTKYQTERVKNLGINDKFIKKMTSIKEASEDGEFHILISLEIVSNQFS